MNARLTPHPAALPRRSLLRVALAALAACCVVLALTPAARAAREIPVGLYNVNNSVMNNARYAYALRFVVDRETTVYRFFSGFNMEGTDYVGRRSGYSRGDGGVIRARLVTVNRDGTPNLGIVLAEERVNAIERYKEAQSQYGADYTQILFFNMRGVRLRPDTMYAMVYQNVAADPGSNWFSENSPTTKESAAGPNGRNNTDPNAPGAMAGLDARESLAWSNDGGASWVWGRRVGEGKTPGAYTGSASSDDGTRLPWYGWQSAPGAAPESNQPYYAYRSSGSYTLRLSAVPRSVTLTSAGGYAPVGSSVGVVTVKNTVTGQTGQTASLGSGLARGPLNPPVPVAAGQSYEISNTGKVLLAQGDTFIQSVFKVGGGGWPFQTDGNGSDRAELFALPHPYFQPPAAAASVAPPPPPAVDPTPRIRLLRPLAGRRFKRALRITAEAGAEEGVDRVVFYFDGRRIKVERELPYDFRWAVPRGLRGRGHRLTARVFDRAGRRSAQSVRLVFARRGATRRASGHRTRLSRERAARRAKARR